MHAPQVSIIIPIYNSSDYLERCIQGVLDQTFRDFELILIDDGSTDNSYNICKKWSSQDDRIKIFQQQNSGASSARNLGLNVSIGEWVLFVDSDDSILPNYCQNLYNAVIARNDIVLAISGLQVVRNNKYAEKRDFPKLDCSLQDYETIFGKIKLHKHGFSVSKLYNRELIEQFHLRFDEKICIAEDCMFMLNYLMLCSTIKDSKIAFLDQCDYLYHIHDESLSTSCSTVEKEIYSYQEYKKTIYTLKQHFNMGDDTFVYLHSPIVFYADRVINSIYKNIHTSKERKTRLHIIDRIEYKQFKKAHSFPEKILAFLFSNGYLHIYDYFRQLI